MRISRCRIIRHEREYREGETGLSKVPNHPHELTVDYISGLVSELRPGVTVESIDITEVRTYGDADSAKSVSTSAQIKMDVRYGGSKSAGLPEKLLAKMSFPDDMEISNPILDAEFENEVLFYQKIRPELDIEAPLGLGGHYDADSGRFFLLMEDISPKSPHINSMADPADEKVVEAVLDTMARLHAGFWESPRLKGDLSWYQNQVEGNLEKLFDGFVREHIKKEMAREVFKREFAEELGATEAEMYAAMKAVKRHQATLPQTILHGDAHFANSYVLPNGAGGVLDFQVSARGFLMHDIGYYIQSSLSVEKRRKHERDLLASYRDRLGTHGVKELPSMEMLWLEYRRSMIYGFYMGWVTAPRENYGWEVMVLGNHRTKAACIDHDSMKLIQDIL